MFYRGWVERVLHETYREVRPAAPVWIRPGGLQDGRESALLVAWRQAIPGDGRTYWHGRCVTVDLCDEKLVISTRWVWESHILAVPNASEDQSAAWNRWLEEHSRRERARSATDHIGE